VVNPKIPAETTAKWFKSKDKDADGKLSEAELNKKAKKN
jgi:hypothetical protein